MSQNRLESKMKDLENRIQRSFVSGEKRELDGKKSILAPIGIELFEFGIQQELKELKDFKENYSTKFEMLAFANMEYNSKTYKYLSMHRIRTGDTLESNVKEIVEKEVEKVKKELSPSILKQIERFALFTIGFCVLTTVIAVIVNFVVRLL